MGNGEKKEKGEMKEKRQQMRKIRKGERGNSKSQTCRFTDLAWASFLLSQSKRMKRRKVLRLVQRKAENLVPVKKQINLKNPQEIRVLKIRKVGERRSTMMIIIMKKINLIILRSITVRRKGQV